MPDEHEKAGGATSPQASTAADVAAELSAAGASAARESAKKETAEEPEKKTAKESTKESSRTTPLTESGTPDGSGSAARREAGTTGAEKAEAEKTDAAKDEGTAEAESEGKKAEGKSEGKSEGKAKGQKRPATVSSAVAASGGGDGRAVSTGAHSPGSDGPTAAAGDPGRPNKPILAGAAMAGAILVAVPLILMATGANDNDKKQNTSSSSSADTVVEDDEQKSGQFVAESPAPKTKSPSPKETEEKKAEPEAPKAPEPAQPTKEPERKPEEKKKAAAPATGGMPPITTRVLIKNLANGTCADIPGGGAVDGPVHQSACTNSPNDNQLWNLEKTQSKAGPGGSDLFLIRNVVTNRCMDLPYYGGAPNAQPVTEYHCDGSTNDNQLWWVDKKSDKGHYWIRNYASNQQCLDSYERDSQNRNLIIFPCMSEETNNHLWYFTRS